MTCYRLSDIKEIIILHRHCSGIQYKVCKNIINTRR